MPRYFLELSYKGTQYSGFQIQHNAVTVQQEVENALKIFYRQDFQLTGSSRTDAGVHALQNFFHFDTESNILQRELYNINALLSDDIVIKNIYTVDDNAHCRFDAVSREYKYYISTGKNPFIQETSYFYPYKMQFDLLQQAAAIVLQYHDFTSFSKKHTQVNNFNCSIITSQWLQEDGQLIYNVKANRFLRGMVRGLVATMLRVGREKMPVEEFSQVILSKDCSNAYFDAPAPGLFLVAVEYPGRQG